MVVTLNFNGYKWINPPNCRSFEGFKLVVEDGDGNIWSVVAQCTLTVHPSSQRTSLKFLPMLELLLRKHTLMIFTWEMFSLPSIAIEEIFKDPSWLVGGMLLQHRVWLSPDIPHPRVTSYRTGTHMTVSIGGCRLLHPGSLRRHMKSWKTSSADGFKEKLLSGQLLSDWADFVKAARPTEKQKLWVKRKQLWEGKQGSWREAAEQLTRLMKPLPPPLLTTALKKSGF